jgi:threonine dehydrogenase-like Zn-dependent dehydrogenase
VDVPDPTESGSSALLKIRQVGICGSNLKMLAGRVKIRYPRVLGREAVGEVCGPPRVRR